jgi:hypothetical protein
MTKTKNWRESFLSSKWLNVNDNIAYKKIINFANVAELINIGERLLKLIRYKLQNNINNTWLDVCNGRGRLVIRTIRIGQLSQYSA